MNKKSIFWNRVTIKINEWRANIHQSPFAIARPINAPELVDAFVRNHSNKQHFDASLRSAALAVFEQAAAYKAYNSFAIFEYIFRYDLACSDTLDINKTLQDVENAIAQNIEWIMNDENALRYTCAVINAIRTVCAPEQQQYLDGVIGLLSSMQI